MSCLLRTAVLHQLLYHIPVHKRLAAKEVYLQVHTVSGIGDQEIQSFFTNLKAHERSSAMVLSLFCEAVTACQIAVMGNVQAQSLHNRLSLLEIHNEITVYISGKQLFRIDQFLDIGHGIVNVLSTVFFCQFCANLF